MQGLLNQEDERVKDLQQLAWSLQSLTNKPGARIPEAFKRDCYRLASKAISLCSDLAYVEESDFVERSEIYRKQIAQKKIECGEVEAAEKAKLVGKCYRGSNGAYTVHSISDKDKGKNAIDNGGYAMTSTAGGDRSLTASEVSNRIADDPEVLSVCGMGIGDGDMETLCQGLKKAGANLTELDVSHNCLADVGVQKLVSVLATGACPKLQELHIGFNAFGDLGEQMLTGGLKTLRKNLVVHLDGDGCQAAAVSSTAKPECVVQSQIQQAQELAPPLAASVEAASSSVTAVATPAADTARCPAAAETSAAPVPAGESEAMQVELAKAKSGEGLEVRAILALPEGVSSAAELDVDVSDWRIVVRLLSGTLVADTALPCKVIFDSAQASFSRKRRTMTVTLQPVDQSAAAAAHSA